VRKRWLIVTFVTGLMVGAALGLALSHIAAREPTTYVLQRDLDLTNTFFFEDRPVPVKGTIAAGSRFEVEMRYSNADYIAFRTVVDRDKLMEMSVPER
jgi:hypothetical protein